jgi:hypothetical protein
MKFLSVQFPLASVTSSHLGRNTLLNNMSSNTLCLDIRLIRETMFHTHKEIREINFYILNIYNFSSKWEKEKFWNE